jgi:hypothetical protein
MTVSISGAPHAARQANVFSFGKMAAKVGLVAGAPVHPARCNIEQIALCGEPNLQPSNGEVWRH